MDHALRDVFLTEYDAAFVNYDRSRLGGTAKVEEHEPFETVYVEPLATFVFDNKIVIVAKDGEVRELARVPDGF